MSRVLAVIRRMKELGISQDKILAVIEAMETDAEPVRSSAAIRQARYRDKKKVAAVTCDVTRDVTEAVTEPEPSRACSNTNLPSEDISNIPPLPPKGGDGRRAEPRNRGHRLPDDWRPGSDLLEFARSLGFSTDQERETRAEFADYWRGVPGSRGCKTDWPATYRNRLREVAGRRKLKPAANVLPFATASPREELSEEEQRRRALDFDRRWKAGEFK